MKVIMDWSYIAGFFDGEGNFKINGIKMTNEKISYQLQIRIDNTNKEVLEKIKKFLGYGQIYTRIRKEQNRQNIYQFTISNKKDALNFLLKIKDLLIEKKPQAEYLLKNFNFKRNNNMYFDVEKLRSFITRKNQEKHRKYKTIKEEKIFGEESNSDGGKNND